MTASERAPETSARRAQLGALAVVWGVSLAVAPSVARASDAAARSLAEQMFAEGRKLMQEGKFDEACPKLAESQRLDAGGGTILNLAVCHESQGKFASAWSEFKEALAVARTDNRRDREQLALEHLARVEPKVSHVTLAVDPRAVVHDLAITLDGEGIGQAAWSSSLPVDPGTHDIVVVAPGKLERRLSVVTGDAGDSQTVSVVPLEDAPAVGTSGRAGEPTPDAAPRLEPQTGKRVAGIVLGAVGLAGVVAGTVYGIETLQRKHESDSTCTGDTCTAQAGVNLNDDAKRFATYSDIGLGVGIVGLVAGTYLIVTSGPRAVPRALTALQVNVAPAVGAGVSGLRVSGTW